MLIKKTLFIVLLIIITSSFTWSDWEDRKGPPPTVYLSQLLENPQNWLDIPVKIPLRFSDMHQIYTPFFTRFDRDNFINFSAWDIHTPIWEKKGFSDDYPFFYVEKDAKEFKAFLRLKKFDTIAVMGKISSIFKGKPYFQIVWVCKQDGDLNINNLKLLHQGTKAFKNGSFDESLNYFKTVYATSPPEDIKALLHKNMAQIFMYEKKNYSYALYHLRQGLKRAKNDPHLQQMYDQYQYFRKNGGLEPQPIILTKEEKVEEPQVQENYTRATNTSSTFSEIVDDNNYELNNNNNSFVETTIEENQDFEDSSDSLDSLDNEFVDVKDSSKDGATDAEAPSDEDEFSDDDFLEDDDFDDRF